MSLVNKMLRDLDARRVGDSDRAALPAAVTPLAARQADRNVAVPLLILALVAVAGLALAAWYLAAPRAPEPSAANLAVPAPAPMPAPPSAPPAPPAAPDLAAAPDAGPPPAPASDPGPTALRQAEELLAIPKPTAELPRQPMVAQELPRSPEPPKPPKLPEPAKPPKPPELQPSPKPPERQATAAASASAPPGQTALVDLPRTPPAPAEGSIDKQLRLPSPAERAEIEYRRAVLAQRQGNLEQAAAGYRTALEDYPEHAAARQTLAALLIEARRFDAAEELLLKGTELPPVRLASTLALARLKVERNQAPAALELLQKHAAAGENSADYQGFAGALLNRLGRPAEAVERYQAATRLAPNEGRWWAGLGIALDSAGRSAEAREAYQKARALPGLPADLAQHVEQRLR